MSEQRSSRPLSDGAAPGIKMKTSSDGGDSETFEQALAALLRDSFAAGTEIEGTWEVTASSDIVPDWQVVIRKTSGAVPPDGRDEFIDT